jgi:basic membrane lipoprotein Med (substrate-binding protein (PBP1-ABC) superfamily)
MRIDKTDSVRVAAGKKNVLTALVGRYKKRVAQAIEKTSNGTFP